MARSRAWKFSQWEIKINLRILPKLRWNMQQRNGNNIVILDTAGRLHIDEDMMAELQEIKEAVTVHQTIWL